MGAVTNKTFTLASAVADDATFTTTYPTGFTQADLQGSEGGQFGIGQDVWDQGADPGVGISFGATTITITNRTGATFAAGEDVTLSLGSTTRNGSYNLTLGHGYNQAAAGDGSSNGLIQELTASGAVLGTTQILDLNHATVVIAATMVAPEHEGLFIIRDTSASGTAAHTVTLTGGTWNGTATIATLNAPGEQLVVFFDSTGRGTIIENTGAVALS
jgi:hypothetical protein